jgi:hypothetical protein
MTSMLNRIPMDESADANIDERWTVYFLFPMHHRPVQGTRGIYRVNMRHGVSRLRSRHRHMLWKSFTTRNEPATPRHRARSL